MITASSQVNRQSVGTAGGPGLRAEAIPIQWNPALPIFAKEEFLHAVGDEYGWLGGSDDRGAVRCFLPYTVVRKLGVRMIRFRTATVPCCGDLEIGEEKSFLNSVVNYFRKAGADVIIPASNNAIFRTYPDGAAAAPYGSYVLPLDRPEATLWEGLAVSHRRQVRSASRHGVTMRHAPEHLTTAHAIIRDTFARSSMPFMSLDSFRRYVDGISGQYHLLVAESQGGVQCSALYAFSQSAAYYVYGGSIPAAIPGAMHLLQWEAILMYRSLGIGCFDFYGTRVNSAPGSKADGLGTFKRRFGAELRVGYLWKYPLSLKSELYNFGVRWLRHGDIVDAEQHKLAAFTY